MSADSWADTMDADDVVATTDVSTVPDSAPINSAGVHVSYSDAIRDSAAPTDATSVANSPHGPPVLDDYTAQ